MKELILVTGGTGYIGSHTAVELINEGYEVVIIDNLSNSTTDSLDGIGQITGIRPEFEQFDLLDLPRLEQFFAQRPNLKAIIHFAASKAVGESVEKPLLYYRNNLNSLINLLHCMVVHRVPPIVFSSSCTVYGQPGELPVTEQAPVLPAESPYGNTKQICEEILGDSIRAFQSLKGISLRYFNPVGAHPSALIGELPRGVPNNLVPYVTQTAAGVLPELQVFGNDYDTPDGSAIRDYINVVDLARAHVTAIRRLLDGRNSEPLEFFNLGTGKGTSVLELVRTFERVTGVKVNHRIVDRRAGDIEKVWADTSKANEILGWKAIHTLDETLLSAWNWEKRLRGIK
ncbi:MAG: UDP-glucose 4-epimerase GalE [Bacteroidales bacterium]